MSRVRPVIALSLAAVAIFAAWPARIIPLNAPLHAWLATHLGWTALPLAVGMALLVAAALIPRARPAPDAVVRPELAPIGVGALFLIEPFLHLAALALAAWSPHAGALDAVLPRSSAADASAPNLALRAAVIVVWASATEETFFRGRLLPWLVPRLGAGPAGSISALAFAAAHGGVDQALVALPLGFVLAALRLGGAPLSACILVHATHNALILIAGGAAARPPAALALMLGGLALIAFGLSCRRALPPARAWSGAALAALVVLAAWLPLRAVHARLWAAAAPRMAASARLGDAAVAQRLDAWVRAGAPGREALDPAALAAAPWPSEARRLCALACWAPDHALALGDDWETAFAALAELHHAGLPCAAVDDLARALALRQPEAFARLVLSADDVLPRWLPLPGRGRDALAQLRSTRVPMHRRLLLGMWERAHPGAVAALLLDLPPDDVTPIDRQHLRRHYPDAAALIAARAAADPAAAAGWTGAR
ncbi:MAG TPA: type II CAAX endopeptidase family protein [Planctomycetota bacterium]|nr:type II CAAX endopeptidase family protein [Planctomycetota bacterium]